MPTSSGNRLAQATSALAASPRVHPWRVLTLAFYVVPALAVLAGKSTVPTLLVTAVLILPGAWQGGWRPRRPTRGTLGLAAALAGWAAVASLWSFQPDKGLWTDIRLLCLVGVGWLLADVAVRTSDPEDPRGRRLARAAISGVALAAALLAVEMLFDMPVKRVLTGGFDEPSLSPSETNRGGTLILTALWLVLPLAAVATSHRWMVGGGLAGLAAAAIALAESGTNQLALSAAAGVFALAWLGRTARLAAWSTFLVLGLLAMPWLVQVPFDAGLHDLQRLGTSIQHRLYFWNYVAEWALERPWFGWGYDSSADLPNRGVAPWEGYTSVIPLHPHNAALQIWLEMGLVGVLLGSAVVVRTIRATEAHGDGWAPWLAAAVFAALSVANTGYGLWQTQWVAALVWLVVYARVAIAIRPAIGRPSVRKKRVGLTGA